MPANEISRHREFLRCYTSHEPAIRAYVRRLVPLRADADDVMQEVAIVLWEKFEQFHSGGDFRAWAFGVARLEVLTWLRDKGRDRLLLSPHVANLVADETLRDEPRLRVDKSRRWCRIVNVASDGREEDWSTQGGLPNRCVITAVRDNMEGDYPSLRNFYRIVPGGMREDARAYADNFPEWNGLDAKGMPAWLLGADLVQTFNADNVNWFMQLTVTVSRPCMLYVLVDRRNPPPAWLRQRFTDTGVDIACEYVDPKYKIVAANGPGQGRKLLPFGAWKLEVLQAGEVKLGPPYFEKFRDPRAVRPNFMYGIAAKANL